MQDIGLTKATWMGRDIETLSREELIEAVKTLGRQLDETRKSALEGIRLMADVAKVSRR